MADRLASLRQQLHTVERALQKIPAEVFQLLLWVLVSLAAIALLRDPPFLALAAAIGGGIFLGIDVHQAYEARLTRDRPAETDPADADLDVARLAPSPERGTTETQRRTLRAVRARTSVSDAVRAFVGDGARFLHWPIVAVLGLNYAWFFLKDQPPLAGVALLLVLLALRVAREGALWSFTPHDLPMAILLALGLVSGLVLTVDPGRSHPKVYGLTLSLVAYYEVAHGTRELRIRRWWLMALSLLGLTMAAVGILGTDWFASKLLNLSQVYQAIPDPITAVPRSIRGGFHPNGVAGALILVIPLYLMQGINLLFPTQRSVPPRETEVHPTGDGGTKRVVGRRAAAALPLLALVITGVTLLLTQSRGAILGLGITGVGLLLAWQRRWILSLLGMVVLLALAVVLLVQFPQLLGSVGTGQRSVSSSFAFRLAVWDTALTMIQDFPFFSAGLGTFEPISTILYPTEFHGSLSGTLAHAHNQLLQVTVDLGFPGLVAYTALLAAFARTAWRAYVRALSRQTKNVVLGLAAGILAHHLFGLTDAFMLGTKPGILMWIIMGIMTGIYHREPGE